MQRPGDLRYNFRVKGPKGFDWRQALRFAFIVILPLIIGLPGLFALLATPKTAYFWADTKDYMAAASDILKHGFSVIFSPPFHPDLPDHVIWFDRPPVYPLILLIIDLIPGSFEIWHFIIMCLFKGLAGLVIYRFLKRSIGQAWLALLVLYSYMIVFPVYIVSDITFLLLVALFAVAGVSLLEKPGWKTALAASGAGILMAFTKPTGAFVGLILIGVGLLGKKTRVHSLLSLAMMGAAVLLWCWRNQAVYGRFAFSQIPDVNTAFYLGPALTAQQTGQEKPWRFGWGYFGLYEKARNTYKERVKALGIERNDRAKAGLIATMAGEARERIMDDLFGYAICHLKYTTRFLLPRGFFQTSLQDFTDTLAKVLILVLACVGFAFWWRKRRLIAVFLAGGALWFLLTPGPVMDARVVMPFYVFSAILAQGGWILWRNRTENKKDRDV
ncbi:MAG: hypothetical protein ABIN58_07905 [candidate division WOR-3 bacterium]